MCVGLGHISCGLSLLHFYVIGVSHMVYSVSHSISQIYNITDILFLWLGSKKMKKGKCPACGENNRHIGDIVCNKCIRSEKIPSHIPENQTIRYVILESIKYLKNKKGGQ